MKVSVSPRRISRRMVKSIGVLFILVLMVLAYASTALIAYADSAVLLCPNNYHAAPFTDKHGNTDYRCVPG